MEKNHSFLLYPWLKRQLCRHYQVLPSQSMLWLRPGQGQARRQYYGSLQHQTATATARRSCKKRENGLYSQNNPTLIAWPAWRLQIFPKEELPNEKWQDDLLGQTYQLTSVRLNKKFATVAEESMLLRRSRDLLKSRIKNKTWALKQLQPTVLCARQKMTPKSGQDVHRLKLFLLL